MTSNWGWTSLKQIVAGLGLLLSSRACKQSERSRPKSRICTLCNTETFWRNWVSVWCWTSLSKAPHRINEFCRCERATNFCVNKNFSSGFRCANMFEPFVWWDFLVALCGGCEEICDESEVDYNASTVSFLLLALSTTWVSWIAA